MKLEQQVCNLELARKLKELGVKQESLFSWRIFKDGFDSDVCYMENHADVGRMEYAAAFTVAELINMLQVYRKEYILVPVGVHFANYLAQELINENSSKKD